MSSAAARRRGLFLNLREEKGYTYGVYSDFTALRYPGPWRAGGNMRTEVTEGALVGIFQRDPAHSRRKSSARPELEAEQTRDRASFALSLEQPSRGAGFRDHAQALRLAGRLLGHLRRQDHGGDRRRRAAGGAQVSDPETMQLVAVGDAGKIKTVLEKYGASKSTTATARPCRPASLNVATPTQVSGTQSEVPTAQPLASCSYR